MIKFKYVEFLNFMSFGKIPTRFNLDRKETFLIVGENKDVGDAGKSKNGVGKSTIFQAIIFALTGRGIDEKMKADDMVNIQNEKKLSVSLVFDVKGREYKIIRGRKPAILEFYCEGETLTRDSMSNTQKAIEDVVGVNYETFMFTFFLSPHKTSLYEMSGPDQRSLLESILSLTLLSERADALKGIKDDINIDLKLLSRDVENANHINQKVKDNEKRITQRLEEFDSKKEKTLVDLIDAKKVFEEIDFDLLEETLKAKKKIEDRISVVESENKEINNTINTLAKEINQHRLSLKDVDNYYHRLKEAMDNFESYEEELLEKKTRLEEELKKFDIEKLKADQVSWDEIKEIKSTIKSLESDRSQCSSEIKSLESKKEKRVKELETLKSGKCFTCHQEWNDKDKIKSLEAEIKALDGEIEDFKDTYFKVDSSIDGLGLKIDEIVDTIHYDEKEIAKLRDEYVAISTQLKNFDDTNVYLKTINTFEEEGITLFSLEESMESIKNDISSLEEKVDYEKDKLNENNNLLRELKKGIIECEGVLDPYDVHSDSSLASLKSKGESIDQKIEETEKSVNPYIVELEENSKSYVDVEEIKQKEKELQRQVTHIDYLRKLLTDSKSFVRRTMIEQYIPFVNKKINEYINSLGGPHVVEINSDLSANIHYMNKNVSYFNLSQGERLRVNVSTAMAFRDLMTLLGKNNNLMLCDELFDSASDMTLIERSYKFLKDRAECVLMISHREDFAENIPKKITVQKYNGFSKIIEN